MNFLEKYWWAILLVVVVIFLYWWFMMREKSSTTTSSNGNNNSGCKTTKAAWDSALATKEAEIRNTPTWLADVQTRAAADGRNLDDAIEANAAFLLITVDKMCDPYGKYDY